MSILLPENALTITRGSSRDLKLKVVTKDPITGAPTKDPYDLTGSTVYFSVKRRKDDTAYVISKISTNVAEIEIPNPVDGCANIFLQPGDTSLDPCNYVYDVWVELPSGARYDVVKETKLVITQGITTFSS